MELLNPTRSLENPFESLHCSVRLLLLCAPFEALFSLNGVASSDKHGSQHVHVLCSVTGVGVEFMRVVQMGLVYACGANGFSLCVWCIYT